MSSGEPINVGGFGGRSGDSWRDQLDAVKRQLQSLQRAFDGMSEQRIISADGIEYSIIGKYNGLRDETLPGLRVTLIRENDKLFGSVTPYGFLSSDRYNIFAPVVPLLAGKPIDDEEPPRVPITEGKYHLILKTSGGRGILDFVKGDDFPAREDNYQPNEWIVLATFEIDGELNLVDPIRYFHTVPQSQVTHAAQFTPILWTDDNGRTWKCQCVPGYVWETSEKKKGIKATFEGGVQDGDKLLIRIRTTSDNSPFAVDILNQKEGEPQIPLPMLEDQAARGGIYFIELCTFKKIDTDTLADGKTETHTLHAEIHHTGPIVWNAMSFLNVGDGEGKIFKDTLIRPMTLRAKSIKNVGDGEQLIKPSFGLDVVPVKSLKLAYGSELRIEKDDDHLMFGGNKNGSPIIFTRDGIEIGRAEFRDGLRIGDTVVIEVGEGSSEGGLEIA